MILKRKSKKEESRINRQLSKADTNKINKKILDDATKKSNYLIDKINAINVSICGFCFSDSQQSYQTSMVSPLENNLKILSSELLECFPILNCNVFRLESFGDLINSIQAMNYINFAYSNPHTTFTLWTKNPHFLKVAIDKLGKPGNLIIIQSSQFLNKVESPKYTFIDGIFTVYAKYYLLRHPEIKINCGARHCLSCLKCYTKKDDVFYINELLK